VLAAAAARYTGILYSLALLSGGAIFETWVVSEIVIRRQNQVDRRGVYHYRDRQVTEVEPSISVDASGICKLDGHVVRGHAVAGGYVRLSAPSQQ